MEPFLLPSNLVAAATADDREAWLAGLPGIVRSLEQQWSLKLGEPFQPGGQTAWVAPAQRLGNDELVLKVGWRHTEAMHEADGLRVWNGHGAVRLHAVEHFDDTTALLLERCLPGTALASEPEDEQDRVIARLLQELWRPPPLGHSFRSLQVMCDAWADTFERKTKTAPSTLDPGLVRDGVALFRALPQTAERELLLCTDLHAENVLSATRAPWLVIDPKPYVGDPTYDPLQHLLNCDDRLRADPHGLVRRVAELLELDVERLELWLFARCVVESADWPALAGVAQRLAPS